MESTHQCPGPYCTRRIPFRHLACLPHWRQVPLDTQRWVNRMWRDDPLSAEYDHARQAAIDSMRAL